MDLFILCLKIEFSCLFLITQSTVENNMSMVVILIPPEVPVGLAPINIKIHKNNLVKLKA